MSVWVGETLSLHVRVGDRMGDRAFLEPPFIPSCANTADSMVDNIATGVF